MEETHVKEVAARQARRVVLLADASKLEAANAPAWTRVEPGWTLLTDAAAPAPAVAAFERRGVTVLTAG